MYPLRCINVHVEPAARRAIRASPIVAKRTRVEIRTPTGKSNYISPQKADQLFLAGAILWTDETHLYAITATPSSEGDYSGVLTKRQQWIPLQSGYAGPTVLQLI